MLRTRAVICAFAAAAVLFVAPRADAEQSLRFGFVQPDAPSDPYAIVAREFKKNVEEKTKGAVQVQLFPNRQLGDEKELLEGVRFGTVDAAVITNAVVANVEKALQVKDRPFRDRTRVE